MTREEQQVYDRNRNGKKFTMDTRDQTMAKRNKLVIPTLVAILLMVSSLSFLHSAHFLSNDDAIEASLKEFKQMQRREIADEEGAGDEGDGNDGTFSIRVSSNQTEPAIPNPTPASGQDTFSSCLLVMDDNHRLVEWMAYHYHVLPLRYLIVAVDPRSKTTPTHILNRWRKMGVYIEEWSDFKFFRQELAANVVSDNAELQVKRDRHRARQKNFYRECLIHMRHANRTYVTLIDTDEFLTYNHKGREDFEAWEKLQLDKHLESKFSHKKRIRPSKPPPTTAEAGALIHYIRQEEAAGLPFFQKPCINTPRLQFGAIESTEEERRKQVPDGFAAEQFDTLRFRKHAFRNDFVKNGLSKSIIDVSRVDVDNMPRIMSLHRPIKTVCPAPWKDEWDSGLRINHYLGSWEGMLQKICCNFGRKALIVQTLFPHVAYSFRDDSRRGGERSREGWEFKARDADDSDDNIRPWFSGFVQEHGQEKAKALLEGAGLPKGYKNPNETAWTIMFLDEILSVNKTYGNDVRVEFDNFVRSMHKGKKRGEEQQEHR